MTVPKAVSGDTVVSATPTSYRGFNFRETGASSAVVRIWDSDTSDTTGDVMLETISLGASGSAGVEYSDPGITASKGIYVDVVSGSVEGTVRIG